MKIPAMVSQHSVTFYDENMVPYAVDQSNPNYGAILAELRSPDADIDTLIALSRPIVAVQNAILDAEAAHSDETAEDYLPAGRVSVYLNEIRYNDEVIDGVLVDRILWMLSEGFDIMPMVRFLENLYRNPADFARDELYLWLEKSDLPITEDGHFLAFKMVKDNFTSHYDGKTKNDPGTIVSMPRQEVDPIRDHTCSRGLHFCSKGYLGNYGWGRGNTVILLKINPADVVSIPSDYDNAKGRAWKYEVLKVVGSNDEAKAYESQSVVDSEGESFEDVADEIGLLEIPSELASALFAAYGEIADDPKDREARLNWASWFLYDLDAYDSGLESFSELTTDQAKSLLGFARQIKADIDADTEAAVADAEEEAAEAAATARQAKINAINSYGIITLRRLTGKWKGVKSADLKKLLIDQVK